MEETKSFSQSTQNNSPPRSMVSFRGTRGVLCLKVVRYWRVEASFLTGRTRALGLNDFLASEVVVVMWKNITSEQKRIRLWNEVEAIDRW